MTDSTMTAMMNTTMDHQTSGSQHGDQHQISHSALTSLIDTMGATHVAINNGSWFSTSTWKDGKIPANGAKVLISEGTTVIYDRESDARINTVAIQGRLKFVENSNTKLVVETMLNGPTGTLDIGTSTNSFVTADKTAKIIFTSDRAISDLKAWDPTQLGKGLVSHGQVNVFGAEKAESIALVGDAIAGDNVLTFKQIPTGWRIGDQIVLGGTSRSNTGSHTDNSLFRDELLTVTAINGNKVSFINQDIKTGDNTVLRYDHSRPNIAERNSLQLYVANTTRNVSFETEGGEAVPIKNRAHVMLMHNPDVQIHNAGFYDLGRSDKSLLVDDVATNVDGSVGNGTNPRGRYALHFHRNGANDLNSQAAIAKGNAVVGSPGWGIVHHDSHANIQNNVVFDVVGAGIAAESGNEIGVWENNTVIKTTGAPTQFGLQHPYRRQRFDFGVEGNAYWVQGAAQVQMRDNVAISSNKTGLTLFGESLEGEFFKDVDTIAVKDLPLHLQKLFPTNQVEVDVNDIPLREFKGFESYNTETGINFWGHMTNPDGIGEFLGGGNTVSQTKGAHEGKSVVEDFKLWGNSKGLHLIYSSNISFETGLIVSDKPEIQAGTGIRQNGATVHIAYNNLNIQGFFQGVDIDSPASYETIDRSVLTFKNSRFSNNKYNLGKVGHDNADFDAFVKLENNTFEVHRNNQAPVARFTIKNVGGTATALSGSESYDLDPIEGGAKYPLRSKGIAAYGWDFESDGHIDQFGRQVNHYFDKPGIQNISLTVWDNQGESSTLTQKVDVQPTDYKNAFVNGDFSAVAPSLDKKIQATGWITDGRAEDGVLKLSTQGKWNSFLHQTIYEDRMRRGMQTFSFDFKNIESSTTTNNSYRNEGSILLWGINGQFKDSVRSKEGIQQIGTLPMQSDLLLRQDFGGSDGEFFDWKKFSFDIDLGNGYDQLFFKVVSNNAFNEGDDVAINNVSLTGEWMPATEPSPIMPILPSPVVQMSFDEGQGKVAADSSGQGRDNPGQLNGSVDWISHAGGYAVAFDGVEDVVKLKNSADINQGIHDQRTVSLWFQSDKLFNDSSSSDKKQVIYEEGGSARGLNIYIDEDRLFVGGWNRPKNESNWKGTWLSTELSPEQIKDDRWQHVALVLDGNSVVRDDAFRAYFNGQLFGSGEGSQLWGHSGGIGVGNVNNGTRFHDGQGAFAGGALIGAVDDLKIYNDALTNREIDALAAAPFL